MSKETKTRRPAQSAGMATSRSYQAASTVFHFTRSAQMSGATGVCASRFWPGQQEGTGIHPQPGDLGRAGGVVSIAGVSAGASSPRPRGRKRQ